MRADNERLRRKILTRTISDIKIKYFLFEPAKLQVDPGKLQ